jgi:hypothetical protein
MPKAIKIIQMSTGMCPRAGVIPVGFSFRKGDIPLVELYVLQFSADVDFSPLSL